MAAPLIVLELNELTPRLMEAYIAEGRLPAFKRLREESVVFVTDAEETPPRLEPWVQWVTVHTGQTAEEHQIRDLSDGRRCKAPRIWDVLSAAGKTSWVCGSMNAAVSTDEFNGMVLPDPWADISAIPEAYFSPYLSLVSAYVKDHSSVLGLDDYVKFGKFMTENGLSAKTILAALGQLASERGSGAKWKRATILDRLQWDMFRANYLRLRPDFSTFFLNSTAHFQHYHWREMEPESFDLQPSQQQCDLYSGAIRHGYEKMDEIVAECLKMAPSATIVLCTALSQQPLTRFDRDGGKQVFRVRDVDALARLAGLASNYEYHPVMAEEFQLRFSDIADATRACRSLSALQLDDGRPLLVVRQESSVLFLGCGVYSSPPRSINILDKGSGRQERFHSLFYALEDVKSGGHHPDGMFWVRRPAQRERRIDRKIPLVEVAPSLIALAGLSPTLISSVSPPSELFSGLGEGQRAAA